jgi:hypothetical protein
VGIYDSSRIRIAPVFGRLQCLDPPADFGFRVCWNSATVGGINPGVESSSKMGVDSSSNKGVDSSTTPR